MVGASPRAGAWIGPIGLGVLSGGDSSALTGTAGDSPAGDRDGPRPVRRYGSGDHDGARAHPDGELAGDIVVESLEELASRPVSRIVVRDPESDDDVFNEMVEALGLRGVSYYIGWSAWVDIVPEGVDKAQGLERVCRELGVRAADVLAMGDGYNDMEMIRWAGRGVALGDSPEPVRAAADHVTGDFRSGGAIQELSRWFQ